MACHMEGYKWRVSMCPYVAHVLEVDRGMVCHMVG